MHSTTNRLIKPEILCEKRFIESQPNDAETIEKILKKYNIPGDE